MRFPGGLALADVPNLMPRIVLYHTAHELRALPATLGFRTGAGFTGEGTVLAAEQEAQPPS